MSTYILRLVTVFFFSYFVGLCSVDNRLFDFEAVILEAEKIENFVEEKIR